MPTRAAAPFLLALAAAAGAQAGQAPNLYLPVPPAPRAERLPQHVAIQCDLFAGADGALDTCAPGCVPTASLDSCSERTLAARLCAHVQPARAAAECAPGCSPVEPLSDWVNTFGGQPGFSVSAETRPPTPAPVLTTEEEQGVLEEVLLRASRFACGESAAASGCSARSGALVAEFCIAVKRLSDMALLLQQQQTNTISTTPACPVCRTCPVCPAYTPRAPSYRIVSTRPDLRLKKQACLTDMGKLNSAELKECDDTLVTQLWRVTPSTTRGMFLIEAVSSGMCIKHAGKLNDCERTDVFAMTHEDTPTAGWRFQIPEESSIPVARGKCLGCSFPGKTNVDGPNKLNFIPCPPEEVVKGKAPIHKKSIFLLEPVL